MIRVLIADDHHLVRQGIRALLEKQPGFIVIGEAKDGLEALAFTTQLQPDVLLIDINMPYLSGIDVIKDINAEGIQTSSVVLSMYSDESLVKRAFQNGAKGFLLKNSIAEDLLAAIESAYDHKVYLSPELRHFFDSDSLLSMKEELNDGDSSSTLTAREREICQLIARGMTNQAVAKLLQISPKTVEKHRANLMMKLGVQDLASLIREALRQGIIFLEE
jgi:two-component system, NarL family, response regulator NreC